MTPEQEAHIESIWKRQSEELSYWIKEHLGPLQSRNISIHELDNGGGSYSTILFDQDEHDAVLIQTDTTAMAAELSHKYMMLGSGEVEKIAEIFNKNKQP